MPSRLGWVDFAEKDRQRMLDVIHLFREQGTVDELGIGVIRDAFADFLFPGTSVVQTRARYMLFIPWMYLKLEKKRIPSADIVRKARNEEINLIYELLKSDDNEGVIGKRAKEHLVRLPSNIYWNGLRSWGIRLFPVTQEEYHRSLDQYFRRKELSSGEGSEERNGNMNSYHLSPNWHPGLPSPPPYFPGQAQFALTREEARYLQERILRKQGRSLLGILILESKHVSTEFIWNHPIVPSLALELQNQVFHAHNFSDTIYGAALLYNLMTAELLNLKDYIDGYRTRIAKWAKEIDSRWPEISTWHKDLNDFWSCSALKQARVTHLTKKFIEDWLKLITEDTSPGEIATNDGGRKLIRSREVQLKRNRARLENARARELWNGASGANRIDFRWSNASWILQDILKGLERRDH